MQLHVNGRYFQFQVVAITLASVDVVHVGYKNINHVQIIYEMTQFVESKTIVIASPQLQKMYLGV
jgi:hypothetical protein